jgi:hypothetical protein
MGRERGKGSPREILDSLFRAFWHFNNWLSFDRNRSLGFRMLYLPSDFESRWHISTGLGPFFDICEGPTQTLHTFEFPYPTQQECHNKAIVFMS